MAGRSKTLRSKIIYRPGFPSRCRNLLTLTALCLSSDSLRGLNKMAIGLAAAGFIGTLLEMIVFGRPICIIMRSLRE
jgi:hypothetical protein